MPLRLKTAADDHGRRLDRVLRKALPDLPLSALHRLLRKGLVLLDGQPACGNSRVAAGQVIEVPGSAPPPGAAPPPPGAAPSPPGAALEVLFEGGGLLILNKPAGRATHGPASLEETVRLYLEPRLPPSLSFTPGPLHRLDKPSSGIIVFSTGLEGAQTFSALIRDRKIRKEYLAITDGVIEQEETWADELIRDREAKKTFAAEPRSLNGEAGAGKAPRQTPPLTGEPPLTGAPPLTGEPPLTGTPPLTGEPPLKGESRLKKASTRILPLAKGRAHTLILALIETGRTHQIRAHAAAHGHPLSGDRKYGGAPLKGGFFLHARALEFPAGAFPGLPLRVEAPLPEAFRRSIELLFHHTL